MKHQQHKKQKGSGLLLFVLCFFSLFASFSVFVFSLDSVDLLCVFFSRTDELLTDSADPANCQTQLLGASVDDSMTDDVRVESDHVEATAGPMGHRP